MWYDHWCLLTLHFPFKDIKLFFFIYNFPAFCQAQWLLTVFPSPTDTQRSAKPELWIWTKHLYLCQWHLNHSHHQRHPVVPTRGRAKGFGEADKRELPPENYPTDCCVGISDRKRSDIPHALWWDQTQLPAHPLASIVEPGMGMTPPESSDGWADPGDPNALDLQTTCAANTNTWSTSKSL